MTAWSGISKIHQLQSKMKMVTQYLTISANKSTKKNISANSPSLTTTKTHTDAMSI